jgi:glycosyltransferase involved in cell wall biosynthesis
MTRDLLAGGWPGAVHGSTWILIAASGRDAARAFADAHGLTVRCVLGKRDLLGSPRRLRRIVRKTGADGVIVHSMSWRRQRTPQLFELALFLMSLDHRFVVDEETGLVRRVGSPGLALRLARLPADGAWDALVIGSEAARLARRHKRPNTWDEPSSVLAVWPGSHSTAGGSLTHIAGILGAFRRSGVRVGLLTSFPPPDRLRAVVDDFEVALPPSEASRLTWDTEQLGANASLRRAGRALALRLGPTFVYQRHCPFLVAGADLADSAGIPLVLEWNGSEAWIRRNWGGDGRARRPLDRLVLAMERNAVSRATVIAAVSQAAAEMAFEAGADPSRTLVVPNAVDIGELDAELETTPAEPQGSGPLLGWAGSFGPWHGAEVAVRALGRLPTHVRLRMIGDGNERQACVNAADALGIVDRVEMTGALPRGEALRRLAECDVLLSPHTPLRDQAFFGSPTKIFEYMALRKPIVASRLDQLGDLFEDGVTARLVTPGDVDELADAVKEILELPDGGRALGAAARHLVEHDHTWDSRARMILKRLEARVGSSRAQEKAGEG